MSVDVTLWSSEAWSSAADVQLLAEARSGSAEAYGELWRRHLPAAYAVASRHRGRSSAEDIVAEASARVLSLIQDGKGPEEHFRSYFLSTVRTVAVDNARRDLRVVPAESDDLEALTDPVLEHFPGDGIDADLVREAFAGLSERDRRVLWHTTVEGEAPRTLAPVLGMTANAVSASAMRARDALRAHYLDAHAARRARSADSDECRWTIDHLGAHVRGRLPKRQAERVRRHLEQCPHAATVAAELTDINAGFPALLVPLILLGGISTPGFVSAGALAGLSAGAVSSGSTASPTGSASGSSAAGSSASQTVVLGQQVAAVASSVAAAIVIGAGVVGASPGAPHGPAARPVAVATPTTSTAAGATAPGAGAPSQVGVPGGTSHAATTPGSQATVPAAAAASGSPTSAAASGPGLGPAGAPAGAAGALAAGGNPAPGGAGTTAPGSAGVPGPSPTSPPAGGTSASGGGANGPSPPTSPSRPGSSSSSTSPTQPPSPSSTSRPAPSPTSTTTPPVSHPAVIGLVNADGTAWLQIPGATAGLRVTVGNFSGTGTLTATNTAWRCTGSGTAQLACTVKSEGRFKLRQGGLQSAQPLLVRFPTILGAAVVIPVG